LAKLFGINMKGPNGAKKNALFRGVLRKIVRKRYIIYSLKYGKMQDT
jgi:hypothetical protein